jgi:hypothetical protein
LFEIEKEQIESRTDGLGTSPVPEQKKVENEGRESKKLALRGIE